MNLLNVISGRAVPEDRGAPRRQQDIYVLYALYVYIYIYIIVYAYVHI